MLSPRRSFLALVLAASVAAPALVRAEAPRPAAPESVGLSAERLQRLRDGLQQHVAAGKAVGVVALVMRNGRVVFHEAFGQADREAGVAMKPDTIFRIASQTKAFTSVSVMMLVEEGKIGLADPLSKFIPAFKKTTVALAPPAGAVPGSPAAVVT